MLGRHTLGVEPGGRAWAAAPPSGGGRLAAGAAAASSSPALTAVAAVTGATQVAAPDSWLRAHAPSAQRAAALGFNGPAVAAGQRSLAHALLTLARLAEPAADTFSLDAGAAALPHEALLRDVAAAAAAAAVTRARVQRVSLIRGGNAPPAQHEKVPAAPDLSGLW